MRRWWLILLLCTIWLGGIPALTARAQAPDAQAVIAAVNALRASRGLAAYTVDAWLMTYAQEHSDYQASIGYSTHTHSDGSLPWTSGIEENVASGSVDFITIDFIVYQVWADAVHMRPMVGFPSGRVGVGVAFSGDVAYYTLNVIPTGVEIVQASPVTQSNTFQEAAPAIETTTLVTSTPLPDGAVYHVIKSGETLWSIALAYGVTVQRIKDLNNIPTDSTDIYIGQKLLIILPGTPYYTPTLTPTQTPLASPTLRPTQTFTPSPNPTRTATQIPATATPQATPTTAPEMAPEAQPVREFPWGALLGGFFLALGGFGLGFWVGKNRAAH